jgi:predicted tellurium resistance membrane protein TerC
MEPSRIAGAIMFTVGLAVLAVEIVQQTPWLLAVLFGVLFIILGASMLADETDDDGDDGDGGEVVPLPRRDGA